MAIEKLSSDEVAATLAQVGPTLRALSVENQALKTKLAHFEKEARVKKLANQMEDKQLDPDTSRDEKEQSLMHADDLDVVEKAIEMSAPQIKLAAVSDHPGNPSDATSAFTAGILDS